MIIHQQNRAFVDGVNTPVDKVVDSGAGSWEKTAAFMTKRTALAGMTINIVSIRHGEVLSVAPATFCARHPVAGWNQC